MRPMLAGMCIHYSIVYTDDDEDGKGVSKSEWEAIQEQNLLTQDECDQLDIYQGPLPTLCATWALDEVKAALVQDQLDCDPRHDTLETRVAAKTGQLISQPRLTVYNRFEDLAREFTGLTGATMELLSQPVPFPYFHVLKILLLVALAILGYSLIDLLEAHVLLSPSVYAVSCFIMIGLQQIAIAMSDPFGDDDVDFDLQAFKRSALSGAIAMLNQIRTPCADRLELVNPIGLPPSKAYHAPSPSPSKAPRPSSPTHAATPTNGAPPRRLLPPPESSPPPGPATPPSRSLIENHHQALLAGHHEALLSGNTLQQGETRRACGAVAVGAPTPMHAWTCMGMWDMGMWEAWTCMGMWDMGVEIDGHGPP